MSALSWIWICTQVWRELQPAAKWTAVGLEDCSVMIGRKVRELTLGFEEHVAPGEVVVIVRYGTSRSTLTN